MSESYLYNISWVGVWRENGEYVHADNPIRTGGSTGYRSIIGIPKSSIMNRIASSSITPRIYLNIYNYYQADSVFNLGLHQETGNKASTGIPFYAYAGHTWVLPIGWSRLDITNLNVTGMGNVTFVDAMNNGYQGIVLYAAVGNLYGEAYGRTGSNQTTAYIEVNGQWNTPPGKPTIIAPTAGQRVQDRFELKASPAIDAEQPASELRYEWSIEDDRYRYYFGWGSKGKTNLIVDFEEFRETNRARASCRAYDGYYAGQWAYSDRFTIMRNKAPGAATLLSPIGGEVKDRTQTIVFNWRHEDAGEQSKFDFRWRLQGTTSWNLITETTPQQLLAVPGNTFPVGIIEWNVRTYDDKGLVGPYSSNGIFQASAPTGAPTITSPLNADTITTSRVTVSWSAADQIEYELRLVENDVILWSEQDTGAEINREIPYDLETAKTYFIFLRVKDSGGIWSPFSSVMFMTAFTPPLQATLTHETNDQDGTVTLYILNPEGESGEPEVIKNDLFRRVFSPISPREQQAGPDFIRIAEGIEKNGTYMDYTPASGVEYEYIVRSYGDNGTISDSNVVTTSVQFKHAFLSVASNPADFVRLIYDPDRSIGYQRQMSKLQFHGREYPVAEYSPFARRTYSMSFFFRDAISLNRFLDFMYQRETLLYRDGRGRRDFVAVETVDVEEKQPRGFTVSFSPERVDYSEEV